MRFKFLGLIAAVSLLAACETAPDESASTTGGGDAVTTSSKTEITSTPDMSPKQGSQEDLVVNVGDRVHFDLDKFNLTAQAREILDKQAAWLQKYPQNNITVEGHCDERGTREYNLALGDRRANAVKDYLTASGIASYRIQTISYGKERPVALGSNEEAWAQNRRSVTRVAN